MKISIFRGGFQTITSNETVENWDEFVDFVTVPEIGPKNGDYFVRGFCDGTRHDENMKSLDLVIIDGDQTLDNGGSCCPPEPVHEAIKKYDITHVIYSSHSSDIVNSRFKWRLVIPCESLVDAESVAQATGEIIALLQREKLMVRNVKENIVLSQPWFTPRCPEHTYDDFYYAYHDGKNWEITGEKIPPLAILEATTNKNKTQKDTGHFSWTYVIDQFKKGTLHMGLKSACGWLIYTTDWADSQIEQHLAAMVEAICPNKEKVDRAKKGEIRSLIKYCREKSGTIDKPADWKEQIITAKKLHETKFKPINWAIDELIPEGLTILAGDPKAGKSLVAVDMCSCIASGEKIFGSHNCQQGTSVYVSLEDPPRRIKDRIATQCDLWPENFKIVTPPVPQLGPDFYRILDEMMVMWVETRIIIIDTMQFIVPPKPSNKNDYDHYYEILAPLHDWSIANHVAVVLITHKTKARKNDGDNPFSGIIGSVAIQGTADAMIMLSRNYAKDGIIDPNLPDGFLNVTGREIDQDCFAMEIDGETFKWQLTNEIKKQDSTTNANWTSIMMVLQKSELKPAEISNETKINKSTTKSCLRRMIAKEMIYKNNGKYGVVGVDYSNKQDKW